MAVGPVVGLVVGPDTFTELAVVLENRGWSWEGRGAGPSAMRLCT